MFDQRWKTLGVEPQFNLQRHLEIELYNLDTEEMCVIAQSSLR